MLPKTLKNFNVFIDGVGYAGIVEEGSPPPIVLKTEEIMNGGMAAPVDVSMASVEKMEFELTLKEFSAKVIGLIGQDNVGVSLRGAIGPDNEAVIIETRALVRDNNQDGWKAGGDSAVLKVGLTANYYKQTINGDVLVEIDAVNMIFNAGGVDHMAGMKTALGV